MRKETIRILLLDDDETQYLIIKKYLSLIPRQRYSVEWVEDVAGAIDRLNVSRYDVCLVDYQLRSELGTQFIEIAIANGYNLPFLLLTSHDKNEVDIEAMESGADDFLEKDKINHHALERAIRYAISRKHSENRFRAILNTAVDGIIVIDSKGTIVMFNPAAEHLFGYQTSEILGQNVKTLMPEPYRSHHDEYLQKYLATGIKKIIGVGREIHGQRKDGTVFPASLTIGEMSEDELLFVGIIHDITRSKEAERKIRDSEHFLNSIIENIPNMIFVKDAQELRFVRFNKAGERLLGLSAEELIGKNDFDFFPKDQAEFFTSKDREVLAGRKLVDIPEEPIETQEGERLLHTKKLPLLDRHGEPEYLLGISEDISELRKAYDTIRAQKALIDRELEQAQETQQSLLPEELLSIPNVNFAVKFIPSQQVGGDFYNVFSLDEANKYGIVVADVTGHGPSAAMISFMVWGLFMNAASYGTSTAQTLDITNQNLQNKLQDGKFATMFYAVYDANSHRLNYTSAGHPPTIVLQSNPQETLILHADSVPVGMFNHDTTEFHESSLHLQPGDRLIIYTDGITEVRNSGRKMLGSKGFADLVTKHRDLPIQSLLECLYEEIVTFSEGTGFQDDVTLIIMELEK